jgi:arsenate reductase
LEGQKQMEIYGLSTCSLCQRARKTLEAAGHDVTFRDVRADPLGEDELAKLIAEFGDRLVDRKTNDYRALNTWLQNSEAEAQISAQPKVMARPIIFAGDAIFLGWDETIEAAVLAE